MLAWKEKRKGELSVSKEDSGPLRVLRDHKGGYAYIKYLFPDEPNVGLGYRQCPDGNQNYNFAHRYTVQHRESMQRRSIIELPTRDGQEGTLWMASPYEL